jgi:hypothetical protein
VFARRHAGAGRYDPRVDAQAIRAAALIVAALSQDQGAVPPSDLMVAAEQYIPWITGAVTPGPARMVLTVEGDPMLNVDSVNEKAVLSFADDKNDPVPPPDGTQATATSSDTGVLTVGAATPGTDANGVPTIEFPLTAVAEGTATLSAHATAADGSPLLGPDGTTPIPDPDPVQVTVNPGAAAAERFTVPDA